MTTPEPKAQNVWTAKAEGPQVSLRLTARRPRLWPRLRFPHQSTLCPLPPCLRRSWRLPLHMPEGSSFVSWPGRSSGKTLPCCR
ncbi:hypothetical protein NRC15 [Methanocella arvoryzae MRE50]|uniref:Uncharacterized protein n=1 Tax=Methanocella arvoryzae (strain DSM 22066 / NBRC 105507 / MRE50) TaxID=351160 RepID=Q0W7D6_METAR|nr:hypothetical protein NRC15 [Methanocella arvoryzae MRE50]